MILEADFQLTGRVAIVTGSARGIGLAIAQALAAAGAAVVIHDIDLKEAAAQAKHLANSGGRAIALGGDIIDPSMGDRLVQETLDRLGGLHILVNCASIQSRQRWTDLSVEEFDRIFHADLYTPLRLCQRAEPILRKQKWGRILNIGSIQQVQGNPNMLPYAMGKTALENMTRALARDFARDGVTVNMIAPGYVDTIRNVKALGDPQKRAQAGEKIAMGRVGEPRDYAGAALLLCSDASQYITGQTLFIDGGLSVQ